ncbi:hypothetical protein BASA81_004915 [Batrachochytrium salamandrivorans]|nr:hypothetical protein BASA81_004915 [Batrachochytrium salamandrivorans]
MKFSVLVAAAMVITSVNAGGDEGLGGLLKKDDGGGPKSEAPFGLKVHPLSLVLSKNKLGQLPRFKLRKKDPICDSIVEELSLSWSKFSHLDYGFWKHSSKFYDLMTGNGKKWEGKKMGEDGDGEDKMHDLNPEEIQTWLKENPEAIPRLQEIKKESIGLEKGHREIWARLMYNRYTLTDNVSQQIVSLVSSFQTALSSIEAKVDSLVQGVDNVRTEVEGTRVDIDTVVEGADSEMCSMKEYLKAVASSSAIIMSKLEVLGSSPHVPQFLNQPSYAMMASHPPV